jgi:hypothetical protein
MSPSDNLTSAETAVRQALLSDRLAECHLRLAQYVSCLEAALAALPPQSDAARGLVTRSQRLFDWAKLMALSSRASASSELDRLRLLARYRGAASHSSAPHRQA